MGLRERLFGEHVQGPTQREQAADQVRAETDDSDIVEVEVRGESHHQDALAAIAGPKEETAKQFLVGVTLRCEPNNEYDENAVRVEVMGQLLGHVGREHAAVISPALHNKCGGVIEARGLIVGGWRDRDSEGHYGIRVWLTRHQADRLSVTLVDQRVEPEPRSPTPELPRPTFSECRLSPTEADVAAERFGKTVTVIDEEHYQDAILAMLPEDWDRKWCPALIELAIVDCNPHSKHTTPCIEVRIAQRTVGYLTPAMTKRYTPLIEATVRDGLAPTAAGQVAVAAKGGQTFWRVKVQMREVA